MKTMTDRTPVGLTGKIYPEDEDYLVISWPDYSEKIDIDLKHHIIRIYRDIPWEVKVFRKSGTPLNNEWFSPAKEDDLKAIGARVTALEQEVTNLKEKQNHA